MREMFTGWTSTVVLTTITAVSVHVFTQPYASVAEKSPRTFPVVEPTLVALRSEPRPTHPDGLQIPSRGHPPRTALKELLLEIALDDDGYTTDEQVEAQIRLFSRSDFSGWNDYQGWHLNVNLSVAETLKELGLEESQLQRDSSYWSGKMGGRVWQISRSYCLELDYSLLDVVRTSDKTPVYSTLIFFRKRRG